MLVYSVFLFTSGDYGNARMRIMLIYSTLIPGGWHASFPGQAYFYVLRYGDTQATGSQTC